MDYPPSPIFPPSLVTWLLSRFPDRLPDSPMDPVGMAVLTGQQNVIRLLQRELDKEPALIPSE